MTEYVMKAPFEVSADELWGTVGNWHEVNRFLPMIISCTTTGGDPGAKRSIKIEGDQWVEEELLRYEPEIRSYTYAITSSSFPFKDYVGTMKINEDPEGGCEFEWSCRFKPDGASEDDVLGIMEFFYGTGMETLAKLHPGKAAGNGPQ
ncbi:SRPBCC family protein [bacterium]|nr:SRPBCC family protein [bacterium]